MSALLKLSLREMRKNLFWTILMFFVCIVAMMTIINSITNATSSLYQTLDHIFRLRTSEEGRLSFSYDRQDFSLPYGDVVSLETDGNYLSIADKAGRIYRTRMTFSAAVEQLDSRFLVLMKGVAVNMDQVAQIQDGYCRMLDGRRLPLHVKRQAALRDQWLNYKFTRIRENSTALGDAT